MRSKVLELTIPTLRVGVGGSGRLILGLRFGYLFTLLLRQCGAVANADHLKSGDL